MQMAAPGWFYHARQGLPLALRAERQSSMARYLRNFALVMILQERGLTPVQMQSVPANAGALWRKYV